MATSGGCQMHSVMPSSSCGTGSPPVHSSEEEVAELVDELAPVAEVPVDGRQLRHHLSSRSPVSSSTSRRAASSGVSPPSMCPLGSPQLSYGSRISRKSIWPSPCGGRPRRRSSSPRARRRECRPRRGRGRARLLRHAAPPAAPRREELRDLHRVRRRALPQVVRHDPQVEHVGRSGSTRRWPTRTSSVPATSRGQRIARSRRARRRPASPPARPRLGRVQRPLQLHRRRDRVPRLHGHAHARRGHGQLRQAQDLPRLRPDLLLLLVPAVVAARADPGDHVARDPRHERRRLAVPAGQLRPQRRDARPAPRRTPTAAWSPRRAAAGRPVQRRQRHHQLDRGAVRVRDDAQRPVRRRRRVHLRHHQRHRGCMRHADELSMTTAPAAAAPAPIPGCAPRPRRRGDVAAANAPAEGRTGHSRPRHGRHACRPTAPTPAAPARPREAAPPEPSAWCGRPRRSHPEPQPSSASPSPGRTPSCSACKVRSSASASTRNEMETEDVPCAWTSTPAASSAAAPRVHARHARHAAADQRHLGQSGCTSTPSPPSRPPAPADLRPAPGPPRASSAASAAGRRPGRRASSCPRRCPASASAVMMAVIASMVGGRPRSTSAWPGRARRQARQHQSFHAGLPWISVPPPSPSPNEDSTRIGTP
jgi:hypothetical protein